jgi:hypothetical protein
MPIADARTIVRVSSPDAYRQKQQQAIRRMNRDGAHVTEQVITAPVAARIDHGRWILDCVCGSGVAVHPDWPEARCLEFGCGRVYLNVLIPQDRAAIETELLRRPEPRNRNWDSRMGDTLETLRAEREQMEGVR